MTLVFTSFHIPVSSGHSILVDLQKSHWRSSQASWLHRRPLYQLHSSPAFKLRRAKSPSISLASHAEAAEIRIWTNKFSGRCTWHSGIYPQNIIKWYLHIFAEQLDFRCAPLFWPVPFGPVSWLSTLHSGVKKCSCGEHIPLGVMLYRNLIQISYQWGNSPAKNWGIENH